MQYELGEPVAERTLSAVTGDGVRHPVTLRVGRPRRNGPDGEWYCPVQIVGIGDEAVRPVFGTDAYQALELCFCRLRTELAAAVREDGVHLVWSDDLDSWEPG